VDPGSGDPQRVIAADDPGHPLRTFGKATHLISLRLVALGNGNVQSSAGDAIFIRFNKQYN